MEFLLSLIICYLIVIPSAKALRDIISFRFTWSIFDNAPDWLRKWLVANKPGQIFPFDGWHQTDGIVVLAPLALLCYWIKRFFDYFGFSFPWWLAIIGFVIVAICVYVAFNLNFHYLFMKREYRGK